MERMHLKPIMTQIKNNRKEGLELLYKHYFQMMYGVAFSILKNKEDSYDVVQNVMLKLFGLDYEKFPQKGELSWLYTVVKNEALMLIRKERIKIDLDTIMEQGELDSNIEAFVDMDVYDSMIEGLNDKEKEIVTLKVLGGLSHKEIAQILGRPMGTIQWLYNVSIKKLRMTLSVSSLVIAGLFIKRFIDQLNQIEADYGLESETFEGVQADLTQWEKILHALDDPILLTMGIILLMLIIGSLIVSVIQYKKIEKEPTNQKRFDI